MRLKFHNINACISKIVIPFTCGWELNHKNHDIGMCSKEKSTMWDKDKYRVIIIPYTCVKKSPMQEQKLGYCCFRLMRVRFSFGNIVISLGIFHGSKHYKTTLVHPYSSTLGHYKTTLVHPSQLIQRFSSTTICIVMGIMGDLNVTNKTKQNLH